MELLTFFGGTPLVTKSATPAESYLARNTDGGQWITFAPLGVGGKTCVSPTAAAINNYETKQGKTIWELGMDSTATGFWVNEYLDPKDRNAATSARMLDYMIIRYAEVLLPLGSTGNRYERPGRPIYQSAGGRGNAQLQPSLHAIKILIML